jgi:integrase
MSKPQERIRRVVPYPESINRLLGSAKLSDATKQAYLGRLRQYLRVVKMDPDGLVKSARVHPKKFEEGFIKFLQETARSSSASTTAAYRDSIKRFLELNRIDKINWDYVNEYVPTAKKSGQDRAPTQEEIRMLTDVSDLRTKCLVLFLCSSGARIGSVPYLKWRDVEDVEVDGVKFAKVAIYRGEPEEYTTFVTPECYRYWTEYKRWRTGIGEQVSGGSYVFVTQGNATKFDPNAVKPANVKTLKNMLGKLLRAMRMRSVIGERGSYRNYEFKQAHGFRKFFKTRMEVAGVKPIAIETMMGHNTGVSRSYYKPTVQELASEYSKAIGELTIVKDKASVTTDVMLATFNRQYLTMAGYTEEEMAGLGDLSQLPAKQVQDLVKQKQMLSLGLNGNHQKIIPMLEVENWVVQGWDFVSPLPNDKAIIRLPESSSV